MAAQDAQKLNEILQAGLEAPGYWAWLFDEPEHIYSESNDPPTHTPAGHWEWIPSAKELFQEEVMARTVNSLLPSKRQEVSGKGYKIPSGLLRSDAELDKRYQEQLDQDLMDIELSEQSEEPEPPE